MDREDRTRDDGDEAPAAGAERPVEPHHYHPSWMHMGDCSICGNLEDSPLHLPRARIRRDLFDA